MRYRNRRKRIHKRPPLNLGDSYFIPATESFTLSGDMTAIVAELRRYGIKSTEADNEFVATLFDDKGDAICFKTAKTKEEAEQKVFAATNITKSDLSL